MFATKGKYVAMIELHFKDTVERADALVFEVILVSFLTLSLSLLFTSLSSSLFLFFSTILRHSPGNLLALSAPVFQ